LDRIPDSIRALRNPLTFFGLYVFVIAFCFCVVVIVPGELPTLLRGVLLVLLIILLAVSPAVIAYLALTPGDRWTAPNERLMAVGTQYGTDQNRLPRNEVLRLPSVEPTPGLLPADESSEPDDAQSDDGEGEAPKTS
jgi:hypothetical protein